jgi:hypothetical protein
MSSFNRMFIFCRFKWKSFQSLKIVFILLSWMHSFFFYQWRIHSNDRHKFIVMNYRNQKSFNVVVMKYKNSFVYVQRQIDRLLRVYRKFVKTYVDDIVIFSRIWQKHVNYLRQIFIKLINVIIFIKSIKTFIDYSLMQFLNRKIDSFDLSINKKSWKSLLNCNFLVLFVNLKRILISSIE